MERSHFHKILRGGVELRRTIALALQALYGVDADWVLTGEDHRGNELKEPAPLYTQKDITPAAQCLLQEKEELINDCFDKIETLKKSIRILAADDAYLTEEGWNQNDEPDDVMNKAAGSTPKAKRYGIGT